MLIIRLQRTGRKHETTFRLVVTDSKNSTKSGKYLEVLGSYDPRKTVTQIDKDRVKHWMSVGAKLTDSVHNLFINEKLISGKKINVLPKKTVPKKEEPAVEAAPAAEASAPEAAATPAKAQTEAPAEEVKAEDAPQA